MTLKDQSINIDQVVSLDAVKVKKKFKSSLLVEEITEPTKSAEERIRVICY